MRLVMFCLTLCVSAINIFSQNTLPVVTNVDFNMRNDGSRIVDITYDVYDAEGQTMIITVEASSDGGVTWNLSISQVTGAVGPGITNGNGKTIIWNAGAEHPYFYSPTVQIRITADDGVFNACAGTPTVYYEGKTYTTVGIGNQCWLRENLDLGTMIPGSYNQQNNSVIEKYCYGNNTDNCNIYGGLYQWAEAMQYSNIAGAQGICPDGWHIPTQAEFEALKAYVNSDGNSLKAIGQGSGAGTGTNFSGFSALLGGSRYDVGYFTSITTAANFWSSTEYDVTYIYRLTLTNNNNDIYTTFLRKENGLSIRCLKN